MTSRWRWTLGAAAALVVAVLVVARSCGDDTDRRAAAARAQVDRGGDARAARLAAITRARGAMSAELPRLTLRGRVVDGDDRAMAGVAVVLAQGGRAVASGDDGAFSFDGLAPGVYAVEARAGERVGGPVRVLLASGTGPVTLRLYRGAIAEVEVVDHATGAPVAGARVRIRQLSMYPDAGRQEARTDERGVARFEALTVIAHEAIVDADGYGVATDTLDPMIAVAGEPWRLRIEVERGARLRGRVVDEAGTPVAGATIEVSAGAGDDDSPRQTDPGRFGAAHPTLAELRGEGITTGADGAFTVALPEGRWAIATSHPAHATALSPTIVSDGRTSPLDLTLVMEDGRAVSGVVVDRAEQPVAGAEVEIRWSFGSRVERRVRADGTGRFALRGLPPGKLALVAIARGASGTPVHVDLSDAAPAGDVVLVLDNDATITGTVRDPSGRAVRDAQVFYVETARSERALHVHPAVVTAGDDGRFTIAGVAPDQGYALTAQRQQDGDGRMRTGGVVARAGEDVTIVVEDDGAVVGRVVLAGRPASRATVELRGVTAPQKVGADGRFRIARVPPGHRTLVVSGPGLAETVRDDIAVEGGRDADAGTIEARRGRVVAGRVTRRDGAAIVGAEVELTGGGTATHAMTGGDGGFELVAPDGVALTARARQRGGRVSEPVAIAADGDQRDLAIVLADGGTIEGDARTADAPIADSYVVVKTPAGERLAAVQTDDAGYFRVRGLPAGSYTLELTVVDPETYGPSTYRHDVVLADRASAFVSFDTSTETATTP
jgi:hypothetical protein